jgi:hypothetical protein
MVRRNGVPSIAFYQDVTGSLISAHACGPRIVMNDSLARLGMPTVFTDAADLSHISRNKPLKVSQVKQNAVIKTAKPEPKPRQRRSSVPRFRHQ